MKSMIFLEWKINNRLLSPFEKGKNEQSQESMVVNSHKTDYYQEEPSFTLNSKFKNNIQKKSKKPKKKRKKKLKKRSKKSVKKKHHISY